MKKNMILAALCILMSTTVGMAKNNGHQAPAPAHPVASQHMNTQQNDAIDMRAIREMHLSPRKYQQVEALYRRASASHSSCNYRYELRQILGQKAYNEYLERVNDHLTAELHHRPASQPQVTFGRR